MNNRLEKLIQKHELILNNPYWAIENDNELKNEIEKKYKLNSLGVKLVWSENLLSSIWVSGGVSIISSLLMAGFNKWMSNIEKEYSKYILKGYLLFSMCYIDEHDFLDILNCIAFDLTVKSYMRYYERAKNKFEKATPFDLIKDVYTQFKEYGSFSISNSNLTSYEQEKIEKYIIPRINLRLVAFTSSISLISGNLKRSSYEEFIKGFIFSSIDDILYKRAPKSHEINCNIYQIVEDYEKRQKFQTYYKKIYGVSNDLMED